MTTRALSTSLVLSAAFLVVYGGTNWLTAQRSDVGTWFFEWELTAIPYVSWLVVPYMSIDLFFFAAPFLCLGVPEMKILARRLLFSILVGAAFFLLMPLRLAWPERPRVGGWFGDFVEVSSTAPFLMEYPHNLFPTLHIAIALILADHYGRHTRGLIRRLLQVWFALIGLSTVLTWQHHVIDVAGGVVLAGFAFYAIREGNYRLPVTPNLRVGGYYAAGAAAILPMVPAVWPWGVFLLWPAAALAIVAGGYFGFGPGIYRKANGRLPLSARFVLWPILLGQRLSLAYYRRRCRAWDEVAPGLLIGRVLSNAEAAAAVEQGVTAVLDLTAEFTEAPAFLALAYRNVPILDLTAPKRAHLATALAFLTKHVATGRVYLHCKIGYSRSAAVAGAYLLATGRAVTVEEAVAQLRAARPSIVIRPEAVEAMRAINPLTAPMTARKVE